MPSTLNKLAVPGQEGAEFIDIADIVRCEGVGNYTLFHLVDDRKIMSSRGLGEYEQALSNHSFFRIHKTHLVNLKMVAEYVKGRGGAIRMNNGIKLAVSRYRKQALLDELSSLFT